MERRSTTATDDLADTKEAIAFISAKLDELHPIRKEISCVLKAVEKLERGSAKKTKKAIESHLDNNDRHDRQIGELLQKVAAFKQTRTNGNSTSGARTSASTVSRKRTAKKAETRAESNWS